MYNDCSTREKHDTFTNFAKEIQLKLKKEGMKGTGKGKPLGLGEAPVAEVYAKAVALGLQMVVESETQDPDGLTEAKICFDYLKSLEK